MQILHQNYSMKRLQPRTQEIKKELTKKATPSEIAFLNKLIDAGFVHVDFQKAFELDNRLVIADFYLRKPKRVVIEIDGAYHFVHGQFLKDLVRDKSLLSNKQVDYIFRLTASQAHRITTKELLTEIRNLKKNEITCLYNR